MPTHGLMLDQVAVEDYFIVEPFLAVHACEWCRGEFTGLSTVFSCVMAVVRVFLNEELVADATVQDCGVPLNYRGCFAKLA